MRLTLRTLLAWLDDTLPPSEVREIGRQVSESPFAQELVEKIHRVTRQRRLVVPNSTGPDATDPNLVASYLDNELDQDLVPEYEKLCLTSDVHMAEVASVHQILSLVGQKAKVPTEARNRMYHLIRGPERAPEPKPRVAKPGPPPPAPEPNREWESPAPPSPSLLTRFGPAAAAVFLILVLGWSAWMSVKQAPQQPLVLARNPDRAANDIEAVAKPEGRKAANVPAPKAIGERPKEPAEDANAKGTPEATPKDETAKQPESRSDLPPGMIGMTEKSPSVLLRYNTDQRDWEQLVEPVPLKAQDRVLNLDPFRSTLALGNSRVDLVGETEVWLSNPLPGQAARFQLAQGRVVLRGTSPSEPYEVQFAGRNIKIAPPAGAAVGVERLNRFEPGNPDASGSILKVYGSEGEVALEVGDAKETLSGPGSIVWDGMGWVEKSDKPGPSWVTETKPPAYEVEIGEQFLKYFRPNRKAMANIVEAMDDEQKDVRKLAIRALRAVGDLSFLVPVLNLPDDPVSRREAIRVLRASLAQGTDAAKAVHDQLVRDLGEDEAKTVEKLLVGYTDKEAAEESTFATLVQQLKAGEVGVRQLSLDNLQALTGRDDMEYDPDKPEGRGLRAWTELLRSHELRPIAAGKPKK